MDGAREIKIHGEFIPVNAQVIALENLSAHADQNELLKWLSQMQGVPRRIFVTHGENGASLALAAKIEAQLGCPAQVPQMGEEFELL